MHIVNFEGLAQASAAKVVWPIVNESNDPILSVDAAKLMVGTEILSLGSGLSFADSEITAALTNAITANLVGVVKYELWLQIGLDKIAVVRGTMNFDKTTVRI